MFDLRSNFNRKSSIVHQINVLGSVITPVTAAAAATSGLASSVQEPGPWRPSKLRLLVDTAYFPAGTLSSFIARQAEHPGWRMAKPASSKSCPVPLHESVHLPSRTREPAMPLHSRLSDGLSQWRQMHGNPQYVHWCRHQKHIVNLFAQQRFSRLKAHIVHRLHERGPAASFPFLR